MEFNRQSIALLQQIKRLAKQEQGCIIHYDSPTLEHELRTLVHSGVSETLLKLIEDLLPAQAPPVALVEQVHCYRGSQLLIDDAPRHKRSSPRIYRGQVVAG